MSNCKCLTFYRQVGGGPSTERHSCFQYRIMLTLFLPFKEQQCQYLQYLNLLCKGKCISWKGLHMIVYTVPSSICLSCLSCIFLIYTSSKAGGGMFPGEMTLHNLSHISFGLSSLPNYRFSIWNAFPADFSTFMKKK